MKKNQVGFTFVELVVMIMVLGILAATAMPKFMNVTAASSHTSAVAKLGGSFGNAVNLVKAAWVAGGNTAEVTDLSGYGSEAATIDTNASGWIIGIDGTFSDVVDCVNIWNALMQNPPTVSSSTGSDYRVTVISSVCTYTYQADTSKNVTYSPTTGTVVVTK